LPESPLKRDDGKAARAVCVRKYGFHACLLRTLVLEIDVVKLALTAVGRRFGCGNDTGGCGDRCAHNGYPAPPGYAVGFPDGLALSQPLRLRLPVRFPCSEGERSVKRAASSSRSPRP